MICIYICYIYANVFLSWAFRAPTATWQISQIYFCQTSYVKVSAVSCRLLSWCKMPGFILIFGARVSSSEHSMLSAWLTPLCQFSMSVCVEWVKVYRDNFIERWAAECVCVCVFEREREREVVLLWGNQAFFPFLRARLLSGSRPSPRSPVMSISRLIPKALPCRAPSE